MRWVLILGVVAAAGYAGVIVADGLRAEPFRALAHAAAAGTLGIDDVMLVIHGPKGLRTQIKEGVTGSGPADDKAWKALKARASTMVYLGESVLPRAKPAKGDAASWKAKVTDHNGLARALAKAVDGEDRTAINTELGKIARSCDGCHRVHN